MRNFLIQERDAVMENTILSLTHNSLPRVVGGHVRLSDQQGLGIEMDWTEWTGVSLSHAEHAVSGDR